HGPAGALAVSLPEASRLSDALAASLRARLGLDPSEADVQARVRALRASVERIRDLADQERGEGRDPHTSVLDRLDTRTADLLAKVTRGADVGGMLGPLEQDAARTERDLIVGASNRRSDAHDEARASALRAELEARGAALRVLAARCVAQVTPAPRLAVLDVSALGPVPADPVAVDAYLARLDAVGRAMTMAQNAYAAALAERDELRLLLGAYAAKAADRRASPRSDHAIADLAELERRAVASLDREPADLVRVRALVAAYMAYLGSAREQPQRPRPDAGRSS
ncbi:MAG: hypothetical protein ABIO16_13040, partial [Nocardioides sp.]